MGSLWLWMFPATSGPVAIKSLREARVLEQVFSSTSQHGDNWIYSALDGGVSRQHRTQTAITSRPGILPAYQRRRRSTWEHEIKSDDEHVHRMLRTPKWLGCQLEPYTEQEGPINFIGKFFAAERAVQIVVDGFESMSQNLRENRLPYSSFEEANGTPTDNTGSGRVSFRLDGLFESSHEVATDSKTTDVEAAIELVTLSTQSLSQPRSWDHTLSRSENLSGTAEALDHFTNIDISTITAYPEWSEITWSQWFRLGSAISFGLAVLWGTCGPAIYVMFNSPPVGLGCDSGEIFFDCITPPVTLWIMPCKCGSYYFLRGLLIYGVLGSLSAFLQMSSILAAHGGMLYYQRQHIQNPDHDPGSTRHTILHSTLCIYAVLSNLAGKSIAAVNALWILAWSLLTYTNVMSTPYCTTAYFSLREKGWMHLWNFNPQQFIHPKEQELGGLVFGSIVAYATCVLIFFLTADRMSNTRRLVIMLVLVGCFAAAVSGLTYLGIITVRKM
ncbi:hypothetical protein BT63DRAFT_159514 [Microthyrium microscopicum]|uniref:Uncharacterized protein n=1 Tax=Microthyrium microscopicum TaxID=703497 RepID=A0A6A6UQ35_9PEZI|nr:hypothetical protein BT63DRAFT_159514 [Microthyrium microscopicum]